MTIDAKHSEELYRYMAGIIRKKECKLIAINGIPNHIHILIDINPKIALSALMRELKHSSSMWMKQRGLFPLFDKWSDGYFGGSLSYSHWQDAVNYIKNQQNHHSNLRFEDEYRSLMRKNGLTFRAEEEQSFSKE